MASTIDAALIENLVRASGASVHIVLGRATDCLIASDAAVVCSGTATLQAALLIRPMVVVYKVSWLSYQILRRLIRVAHIALVNLIAGEALVPELVQGALTPHNIRLHVSQLLKGGAASRQLKGRLRALRDSLGQHDTGRCVALEVLQYTLPAHTEPKALLSR